MTFTPPRDRWGRALVPNDPFPSGEPVWHHRPSGIAKKIADTYNLQQWEKRMVLVGATQRPDLLALADSCDPDNRDDKRRLNGICDDLKEAAKGSTGSNLGTALHNYIEQINLGNTVRALPTYQPDLDAYQEALEAHDIQVNADLIEQFVVWPEKRIAGSLDFGATVHGSSELFICDPKTGQGNPADFSMMEYAAQLAAYANCTHTWDGTTAVPLPEINREVAYIVWLPAGQGHCELIEVDIAKGLEYVDLALTVYWAQKDKGVGRMVDTPAVATAKALHPSTMPARPALALVQDDDNAARRAKVGQLRGRLGLLVETTSCTKGDVMEVWPEGQPALTAPLHDHTDQGLDRIEGMVMLLEMTYGLGDATPELVEATKARLKALPADLFEVCREAAKALEPPIPHLDRCNSADLDRLEPMLAQAELAEAERMAQLTNHLSPLDEADADAIVAWATEQRADDAEGATLATLTSLEAERTMALAELYDALGDNADLMAHLVDELGL